MPCILFLCIILCILHLLNVHTHIWWSSNCCLLRNYYIFHWINATIIIVLFNIIVCITLPMCIRVIVMTASLVIETIMSTEIYRNIRDYDFFWILDKYLFMYYIRSETNSWLISSHGTTTRIQNTTFISIFFSKFSKCMGIVAIHSESSKLNRRAVYYSLLYLMSIIACSIHILFTFRLARSLCNRWCVLHLMTYTILYDVNQTVLMMLHNERTKMASTFHPWFFIEWKYDFQVD